MDIATDALKLEKRRRGRAMVVGLAATIAVVVGVVWNLEPAVPTIARSELWLGTVRRGDMTLEVQANGTLVPRSSRWLAAATPAQVKEIVLLPGASVHRDSVVMRLSNPELEDSLRNARQEAAAAAADVDAKRAELASELLDVQAGLAEAEAGYASANVRFAADAKAADAQLISRVQFEQSQIALDQLRTRVEIERRRVKGFEKSINAQMAAVLARAEQQRNVLALRQSQAAALDVVAGIDGVLQEVAVQEGAQVAAGTNLARVAKPDELMARLQVSELQAQDVAVGMPVVVDTHNGFVKGTVERIDPAVRDGDVEIDVLFTAALPRGSRPDLSVEGRVRTATLHNVLSVERPAAVQSNTDSTVLVIDPSGDRATKVLVRIGATSVDRAEIVRGLKEGDRVVLSDTSRWIKFDRVRLK